MHAYAPHDDDVPVVQTPFVSHTEPCTVAGPEHTVLPHAVPGFATVRHAPDPARTATYAALLAARRELYPAVRRIA